MDETTVVSTKKHSCSADLEGNKLLIEKDKSRPKKVPKEALRYVPLMTKMSLVYERRRYYQDNKYKNGAVSWRCSNYKYFKCPGTMVVSANNEVIDGNGHTCTSMYQRRD